MLKIITLMSKLAYIGLFLTYISSPLYAEESKYLLQADIHTALIEIQQDMENNKHVEALRKLKILANTNDLNDYDLAVIYQTMGYAENGLNNFDGAAKHFIKSLSYNALPKDIAHGLTYTTAQLLIHLEQYNEGLDYLQKWFSNEFTADAEAHILAASAYYQIKEYKKIITHVEKAISLSDNPPFNWYELLLVGYIQTKDYNGAASTLETIINLRPEKTDFWFQLANIYNDQKKERKALAVYELAYAKGILKNNDIIHLVRSYLYHEMPYKAGILLEQEINSGNLDSNQMTLGLLVDSWLLAHEKDKAKSVFNTIIEQYNDEYARLRLGQLCLETEEWDEVINVLDVDLNTKDSALKSKINLLLGIAQYYSNNIPNATRAFTLALSDKSTSEQAKWWLEYLKKKTEETKKENIG